MRCCPVNDCDRGLTRDAIVCFDCFMKLSHAEFSLLVRTRSGARRAAKESDREHLRSQFEAYLTSACLKIAERRKEAV